MMKFSIHSGYCEGCGGCSGVDHDFALDLTFLSLDCTFLSLILILLWTLPFFL